MHEAKCLKTNSRPILMSCSGRLETFLAHQPKGNCRSSRLFPRTPFERCLPTPEQSLTRGQNLRSHQVHVAGIDAAPLPDVCSAPTIDSVAHQAGRYTVRGHLETGLPREAVLGVLTEYESLARIYSSIEDSRQCVINGTKGVVQLCHWEFLVFSGTFETELTVEEDLTRGIVVFRLVSSSFMRQFEGRWQVSELTDGSCRVEHQLSVEPIVAPPQAFAGYTQKIFVRQVERLLEDLSQELCRIQSRSAAGF